MASSQPTTTERDLTPRERRLALWTLCVGVLMIVLDTTVVNVALPSIQDDLGFTPSGLAWVVNGYLIAYGGLLLLAGRLGDLLGSRAVYLAGLVVFTGASVLCGVSQSQAMLVGSRFLQGLGGALASAVILGMIVRLFPDPKEQAKAMGTYAFVASGGGAVGLLAGGLLTEGITWHWIFFVNVPIGVATIVASMRLLPKQAGLGLGHGADYLGAALVTGSLMLAAYTIIAPAAELGWGAPRTLLLGGLAAALLGAFVARQARVAAPLMALRVFRGRNLAGANVIQVLSAAAMFGVFFLGSLYLQRVLGYGPLEIGLAYLPMTILMAITSVKLSHRIAEVIGTRTAVVAGLGMLVTGAVLLARVPVNGDYVAHFLPSMVLMGLGAGTCFPSLMMLGMGDTAPEDAGLASGLLNTTAQVGGALGLATLATLSAPRGGTSAAALTAGFHVGFWGAALLLAGSVVVAVTVVRAPATLPEPLPAKDREREDLACEPA